MAIKAVQVLFFTNLVYECQSRNILSTVFENLTGELVGSLQSIALTLTPVLCAPMLLQIIMANKEAKYPYIQVSGWFNIVFDNLNGEVCEITAEKMVSRRWLPL